MTIYGSCQILMVLSLPAEARVLPSGLKVTLKTLFVWPFKVRMALPFWVFQSRTV